MAIDWADKIRKVLAKAEDPAATEEERASFLASAQRLAKDHAVDMHNLGVSDPQRAEAIEGVRWFADDKHTTLIKAKRELLFGLATLNRCRTVLHGRAFVNLIGHQFDMEIVSMMFTSVMLQLQTAMVVAERTAHAVNVRSWRVSYAHGYVRRVIERLRYADRSDASIPGTALVLVDRTALVNKRLADMYPKLRIATLKTSADSGSGAYARGVVDGSIADLGGARLGGSTDRHVLG